MRNDIRGAFDEMLPEPHPALQSLVHERLRAGRKGRENVTLQRFIQIGAALVAIVILGAVAFSFRASGQRQHGGVPVGVGTPSPSPSPTAIPDQPVRPLCSGTYTVTVDVVVVTFVTDQAPLQLVVNARNAQPGSGVQKVKTTRKGETTVTFTLTVPPPVSLVELFINGPHGGILGTCVATPSG